MDDIIDRIKLIIEKEQIPSTVFAESIDVKQSTFSHILTGRNKPSLEVVMKVHRKYNYVNLDWLLYGEGSMLSSGENSKQERHESQYPEQNLSLPLFDQNPIKPYKVPEEQIYRKEMPLETPVNTPKETVIQEIKYIERPHRKITEIRIFFDYNTYETFKSEK